MENYNYVCSVDGSLVDGSDPDVLPTPSVPQQLTLFEIMPLSTAKAAYSLTPKVSVYKKSKLSKQLFKAKK